MVNEKVKTRILRPLTAVLPVGGGTPLSIDFGSLNEYFELASNRYDEAREDYLHTAAEDPKLLDKTQKWAKAARMFSGWAQTLYFAYQDDAEQQQFALDLMDRITKESGLRLKNILLQFKLVKKNEPDNTERLKKIDDAYFTADFFLRCAVMTQQHYIDRLERGDNAYDIEYEADKKAGAQLARIAHLFPPDRLCLRGIIFPPARVPVGQPLPQPHEVYSRVKFMPPEDLVYDPVADELVVRPGYVSEDGKVDDHSVIWHPENHTVEMGYVGEEKMVWPYWKPKDNTDNIPEGSWCEEYVQRSYREWLESGKPGLFKHKPWDSCE